MEGKCDQKSDGSSKKRKQTNVIKSVTEKKTKIRSVIASVITSVNKNLVLFFVYNQRRPIWVKIFTHFPRNTVFLKN